MKCGLVTVVTYLTHLTGDMCNERPRRSRGSALVIELVNHAHRDVHSSSMWSSTSTSSADNEKPSKNTNHGSFDLQKFLLSDNSQSTRLSLISFSLGIAFAVATSAIHKRYFYRFKTGDWVTPDVFEKRRWIKGVVTK